MRAAYQREIDALEGHLAGLATVGSVVAVHRPLRNRVGIIDAFRGSAAWPATLANVAPGIADALFATALGLVAAIPAVIAFNRYTHDVDRLAVRSAWVHRGVLEHPPASRLEAMKNPHARLRTLPPEGAPNALRAAGRALTCAAPANGSTRSTSCPTST